VPPFPAALLFTRNDRNVEPNTAADPARCAPRRRAASVIETVAKASHWRSGGRGSLVVKSTSASYRGCPDREAERSVACTRRCSRPCLTTVDFTEAVHTFGKCGRRVAAEVRSALAIATHGQFLLSASDAPPTLQLPPRHTRPLGRFLSRRYTGAPSRSLEGGQLSLLVRPHCCFVGRSSEGCRLSSATRRVR
jgi:hypothetical protein